MKTIAAVVVVSSFSALALVACGGAPSAESSSLYRVTTVTKEETLNGQPVQERFTDLRLEQPTSDGAQSQQLKSSSEALKAGDVSAFGCNRGQSACGNPVDVMVWSPNGLYGSYASCSSSWWWQKVQATATACDSGTVDHSCTQC